MRVQLISILALLAASACAGGADDRSTPFDGRNPLAPATGDEIEEAVAAFRPGEVADHAERSAVDSLSADRRSGLDSSASTLAALLPSPEAFGDFRLALLQVDDPNGDGRIGGNWYPPRVLRQDCSAKVDSAPFPFAIANYLPGEGELDQSGPMTGFDVLRSALSIGVQVFVFDDASQRDDYLAATVEFLRDPTFSCGSSTGASVQTFRETELRTVDGVALVFEAETAVFGGGVTSYLAVGDRLLLGVSVACDAVEPPWTPDDLDRWLAPVIAAALERIEVSDLPE